MRQVYHKLLKLFLDEYLVIAVDPTNPNTIYLGSQFFFYRSVDGGTTWIDSTSDRKGGNVHGDHHAITIDRSNPNTIYNGNDGGIWRGVFGGADFTWTNLNTNLAITEFYAIAPSQNSPLVVLGGTQDNGAVLYTGNKEWSSLALADVEATVMDSLNSNILYWKVCDKGCSEVSYRWYRSTDFGKTVTEITPRMPSFLRKVVAHPSQSGALFGAGQYVFQSTNMGDDWSIISPDFGASVGSLAVASNDASIMYAGTKGNLWLTTNAGTSWTSVYTSPLPTLSTPRKIIIDSRNNQIAYVAYVTGVGGLFMTNDGGRSWKGISPGLFGGVWLFELDSYTPGKIYVLTDLGIYQTSTYGTTWSPINDGLPKEVSIEDLQFSKATGVLLAATYGRSVFCLGISCDTNAEFIQKTFVPIVQK